MTSWSGASSSSQSAVRGSASEDLHVVSALLMPRFDARKENSRRYNFVSLLLKFCNDVGRKRINITVRIRVGLSLRRGASMPAAGRSVFRAIEQLALNSRHLSTRAGRLARHRSKRRVAALFTGLLATVPTRLGFPWRSGLFLGSGGAIRRPFPFAESGWLR